MRSISGGGNGGSNGQSNQQSGYLQKGSNKASDKDIKNKKDVASVEKTSDAIKEESPK